MWLVKLFQVAAAPITSCRGCPASHAGRRGVLNCEVLLGERVDLNAGHWRYQWDVYNGQQVRSFNVETPKETKITTSCYTNAKGQKFSHEERARVQCAPSKLRQKVRDRPSLYRWYPVPFDADGCPFLLHGPPNTVPPKFADIKTLLGGAAR